MFGAPEILLVLRIWVILVLAPLWREAFGWLWWLLAAVIAVVATVSVFPADATRIHETLSLPSSTPSIIEMFAEVSVAVVVGRIAALPGAMILGVVDENETRLNAATGMGRKIWAGITCAAGLGIGAHRRAWEALILWSELAPPGEPWRLVELSSPDQLAQLIFRLFNLAIALMSPVWLLTSLVDVVHATSFTDAQPKSPMRIALRFTVGLVAWWASWRLSAVETWPFAAAS
jgi:hypothetical protein